MPAKRANDSAWRRMTVGTLSLALLLSPAVSARAQSDAAAPQSADTAKRRKLLITIVASESMLPNFGQRVSSWFTDGTEVSVTVTSEVDAEQLLATGPGEVRAWVVPLSAERALVTFSCMAQQAPTRHLVRVVRLRNGLDDLGLERLASVIHSAFVALSEGTEGLERSQAERELGEAGVSAGSHNPPAEFVAPIRVPTVAARVSGNASRTTRPAPQQIRESPAALLFAAGYGARLRGAEGLGHGPDLDFGLQIPGKRTAIDVLVSGQLLLPSDFDADLFSASVQTTALRLQVGIEPALTSTWFGQALVGAGADIAQVHASTSQSTRSGTIRVAARESGTQWRSAGELTLGVLRHTELLDVGVYARVTFQLEDVHYSATTDTGDQRLLTPWLVQPGLCLQGRFRTAL